MVKVGSNFSKITAGITLSVFCAVFLLAALHKDPEPCDPDPRITFYSLSVPDRVAPKPNTQDVLRASFHISSCDFECPLCFWQFFSKRCPESSGLVLETADIVEFNASPQLKATSFLFLSSLSARGPPCA